MTQPNRRTRGFTLIELLVVIAIIGMLASVIIASLNSARAKARDAARKTAIRSMVTALSLYYSNHGSFPAASYGGACGTAVNGSDIVSTALKGDGLISAAPIAPSNSGTCGDAYYTGAFTSDADLTTPGTAQRIAVLTKLENPDTSCTTWTSGVQWFMQGSYCNSYFIQIVQ